MAADSTVRLEAGLNPGTTYYVWVSFFNNAGETDAKSVTANVTTAGTWKNTQMTLKSDVASGPNPNSVILPPAQINNFLEDSSGLSIGDRLLITTASGKTEEVVIDGFGKNGELVLQRNPLLSLKTLSAGSTIKINHDLEWFPAGANGKIPLRLGVALIKNNKAITITCNKIVNADTPILRVGDYIKINNEIIGPITKVGIEASKPAAVQQASAAVEVVSKTPNAVVSQPSKPGVSKVDLTMIEVGNRGALSTLIAGHDKEDAIYVNHK